MSVDDWVAEYRERKKRRPVEMYHIERDGNGVRADAAALANLIPKADPRSLTGQLMGDPLPNDPRRPWRNW